MDKNDSRTTDARTTARRNENGSGQEGVGAVRVDRRSYLKLLGAGVAVPVAGTARADDYPGYGVGGYGTGA